MSIPIRRRSSCFSVPCLIGGALTIRGASSGQRRDRRTHARRVMTAASEGADSSKTRFHRQMMSVAAAITIPVTNAVKQENSSRSLRTTLMAASPCEPCYSQSAAHTSTVAEK